MAPSTRTSSGAVGASSLDFLFLEDFPPIFLQLRQSSGQKETGYTPKQAIRPNGQCNKDARCDFYCKSRVFMRMRIVYFLHDGAGSVWWCRQQRN